MKAFLTAQGAQAQRTHDLAVLGEQCLRLDATFEPWITQIAGLSEYAVEARYPGAGYPSEDDAREASRTARAMYEFILDRLNDRQGNHR